MNARFEDIPRRIFLDSSTLQALQTYGGFLYESESIAAADRILQDPKGMAKLNALRFIMLVGERAPFEFALSANSFVEVQRRRDQAYLQWAYDVLGHWHACLEASGAPGTDAHAAAAIDGPTYNYLGRGDRELLKDALSLRCDTFLTMENRLPKCGLHIQRTLGIRILSPIECWDILRPWVALFR